MDGSTNKERRRKVTSETDDIVVLDDTDSPTVKREVNAPKRRKNDVINDEEVGLQPIVSGGMRELEPIPPSSPEVLELRQLLIASKQQQLNLEQQLVNASQMLVNWELQAAKKEEMYQSMRRAKEEAELRAEQAEKLVDTKRPVFDDLKRSELEEKIADLTKRNDQLEKQKKQGKKKIEKLTNELEEEKKKGKKRLKKIKQLKLKLAEYEISELESEETADAVVEVECNAVIHLKPPPPNDNIFVLISPSYEKSISIDKAVQKVRDATKDMAEQVLKQVSAKYNCDACGVTLDDKLASLNHFLSEGHIEKVRAHGAVVSMHALRTWLTMAKKNTKGWIKLRDV